MPWGVEELSKEERFAKAILAGVDQIGGSDESEITVAGARGGATNLGAEISNGPVRAAVCGQGTGAGHRWEF
jgi:hypothetical protein